MTRRGGPFTVNELRERIRERVEASSLRSVAAAVGVSHNALKGFLEGSVPHRPNRRKYLDYLSSDRSRPPDRGATKETRANVEEAVEMLTRYINAAPARDRARRLREVYRRLPAE